MLDSLINFFAPRWAANRAHARAERLAMDASIEAFNAYRGSVFEPIDKDAPGRRGAHADAYNDAEGSRRIMVDRARHLERNNTLADALLTASTQNVIGTGIRLQMMSDSTTWNEEREGLWAEWCRFPESRRRLNMTEVLQIVLRSYLRDGDIGGYMRPDGLIRLTESDEIATPTGGTFHDPNQVDGIDLNDDGQAIAYHIAKQPRQLHDRRFAMQSVKIPADQMLFLARMTRAGETRGPSAFATVFWLFDQIEGQIQAVTAAARMAACFGLVIKRETRFAPPNAGKRRQINLRPAGIFEMFPGETIEQIKPEHPGTDMASFIRLLSRYASLPFGIPFEIAFLDFSETNFSNARASMLQAWQGWTCLQNLLKNQWLTPLYYWKEQEWLKTTDRRRRPKNAFNHRWLAPAWRWVDPEKEIQAAMAAIDGGLDTVSDTLARLGKDPDEILATRKRELEAAEEAGVPWSRSRLTRDEKEDAGETTPPSEEKE